MAEWTMSEVSIMRRMHRAGRTLEEIAEAIPRHTPRAVRKKGYELTPPVSWRRKGSTRGLIIGQPRSVSLADDAKTATLRALVLAGKVKPHVVTARLALAVSPQRELCPSCGKRPVTASRTGLCGVCHKDTLIEVQEEQLAELEAHKAQQVVWQAKSRLKKELGIR